MSNPTSDRVSPFTRRVVTGKDADGKSVVLYDDTKGNLKKAPNGSIFKTVWYTDGVPADCSTNTNEDPTTETSFIGVNDGTVCTIVVMQPGGKAPMHSTKSIDYAIILEGELELILESGDKRLLKSGDVIVQREAVHAWHNPQTSKITKFFCVCVASNGPGERFKLAG